MRLKRLIWLLLFAALVFVLPARADTVTVNGTYAFANNGYGIPPYGGTLNNQTEQFFCVDFSSTIKAGDTWDVFITSLTGSNFSSTRLKDQTKYLEMTWLITKMMSATTQDQKAEYQYAIWSFTGGPNPYGTNGSLVAAAAAAIAGFSGQGWEILTPTGSLGQEFLIFVPEPGDLVLLMAGLLTLLIVQRRRLAARAI